MMRRRDVLRQLHQDASNDSLRPFEAGGSAEGKVEASGKGGLFLCIM